jgi:hypothetical protein
MHVPVFVRGILGAWTLIILIGSTTWASPTGPMTTALELHAALDDSAYLPGQPIYLLVSAKNVSDTTFHDLGHISASMFLDLRLFRGRHEVKDHYLHRHATFIVTPGRDLDPGARVCGVHDLLDGFGEWIGIDMPFGSRLGPVNVLSPGRYRLVVRFRSHVHWSGSDDWLDVTELNFRVFPPSAISPLNERALRRLAEARRKRHVPNAGDWNEVRKQGLDRSRYVGPLANWFIPDDARRSGGEFAVEMARVGVSPIAVGGVLRRRAYTYMRDAPREGKEWIDGIQRSIQDSTLQCLLSTWDALMEEGLPSHPSKR